MTVGVRHPTASKDLADLAILLAGRPQLPSEVAAADVSIRRSVAAAAALLLAVPELASALRSHFRDRQPIPPDDPDSLAVEALAVLEQLRESSAPP